VLHEALGCMKHLAVSRIEATEIHSQTSFDLFSSVIIWMLYNEEQTTSTFFFNHVLYLYLPHISLSNIRPYPGEVHIVIKAHRLLGFYEGSSYDSSVLDLQLSKYVVYSRDISNLWFCTDTRIQMCEV